MTRITGNDERDAMIFAALKTAMGHDQVLSLGNVKAALPSDFDLLPSELMKARHAAKLDSMAPLITTLPDGRPLPAEPTPEPEPEALPRAIEQEPEAQAPEAKLTQQQARAAVEEAAKRLAMARIGVRGARSAVQIARGKLAEAVTNWQNRGPRWSAADERKAMLHAYATQKAKAVLRPARVGNSYIDRAAAYRGDANDMVRKHPVPVGLNGQPGKKGFRRGAYPSQYQHLKVPSAEG
jgi:hypothetical protein